MRSRMFWVKAALLVTAAVVVPACGANKKLAAPIMTAVLPTTVSGVIPNIMVQFDRAMDPATAGSTSFYAILEDPSTTSLSFTVEFLSVLNEVRIIPNTLLNPGKTYHVYVAGGVKSAAGTAMGNTIHFDFITAASSNATATNFIGIGWSGATPSNGATGEIVLTWPDATEYTVGSPSVATLVASYDIYMSTTDGGEDLMIQPSIAMSPSLSPKTISGLVPGTTYFFKIQPRDSANSVFKDVVQISFVAPP
jgi:hypothetical protein